MKRLYFLIAGAWLLAACSGRTETSPERQTVRVDTVRSVGGTSELQYPGKVKAAQDITLAFRVSGTIDRLYVEEGARVRKGQLLAALDPTDYRVQLEATEAEYRQVKGDAERVIALYKDGGTTPSTYDKAVYGLQQITAKYEHHKDQLAYTKLYAPFDGFVQKRLFKAHETVGAGMPVLSVVSEGRPEVEINLPAAASVQRERFATYQCTFDIYPDEAYPLSFISITPKANANQLYTMRLQLEPGKKPLPSPGMNTMVTIRCAAGGEAQLSVPGGALMQQEGKSYLFRYDAKTKKVTRCEVKIVRLLSDGHCIVASPELKAGELVVASGVHHIGNGEIVEPLPAVTGTNVGGLL